jgi:hypothetical protein
MTCFPEQLPMMDGHRSASARKMSLSRMILLGGHEDGSDGMLASSACSIVESSQVKAVHRQLVRRAG